MIITLNESFPTARKEHKCMWCGGEIKVGEKYERCTNLFEGQIYDWVVHLECRKVASLLNMFDDDDGYGIDMEHFIQSIQDYLYDHHYNEDTETYDEGFDPDEVSYHDIVKKIIQEKGGEITMEFKSQPCTSVEQSKRLFKLGLKKETADMSYIPIVINHKVEYRLDCSTPKSIDVPAWSLHRLLFLIPKEVNINGFKFPLKSDVIMKLEDVDGIYELLIGILERIIKEGYFNKNYLEE